MNTSPSCWIILCYGNSVVPLPFHLELSQCWWKHSDAWLSRFHSLLKLKVLPDMTLRELSSMTTSQPFNDFVMMSISSSVFEVGLGCTVWKWPYFGAGLLTLKTRRINWTVQKHSYHRYTKPARTKALIQGITDSCSTEFMKACTIVSPITRLRPIKFRLRGENQDLL